MLQFFTTEKEEEMSDLEYHFQDYFLRGVQARVYQETGKQMPDCTYAAVKARRELEETILEREKAFLEAQARAAEAAAQARAAAAEAPPPCYREGDSLQMHTSEGAAPPPYTASIGVTSV